ncbi:DEDD exonuclease domain-containing protein [Gordonia hydrophobica]|uniref:DEDD exonuclease domain-containing protein n=1 Tax=Gordonia hydrophobica TaxID=40516 RepID=A0ABZ2TYP5_9ACTN|nr:DEDD exonuclease domain-containing protein [Gordonia hydrophobica]MBM7367079.1 DNA polymerase-3 subunit epsilon [Gordonia hydrophobica]
MAVEQLSFSDLPESEEFAAAALRETTFVVVDLETTGGSADDDRITEIGAVKIRGGEVLGEFATLVDPGRTIPPQIVTLTGITTAMVYDAPRIEEVLPAFIEFARGSVLVAHNARFDMGFLRKNAARMKLPWEFTTSLCTVVMARRVLSRQEAPSVKLSALAELFDVSVRPTHRALDDARATVDVFHRLIERVGNQGVETVGDLTAYLPRATPAMRAKRAMAAGLPHRPGVYLFRGPGEEVLYIGTAVDLHRRVAGYFNGSDPRSRMAEMVSLAIRVDHVECAHALEAAIAELTLLGVHKPSYNRRSRNPQGGWWISLTAERFPRLTVSRTPSAEAIGPLSGRSQAADVADVISGVAGLRTCTTALKKASHHWCAGVADAAALPDPLVAAVPGVCRAASDRPQTLPDYLGRVEAARDLLAGRSDVLLASLHDRVALLARERRFESAARARDRLSATIEALSRSQRLAAVAQRPEVIGARPDGDGGWELAVIRYGRLAGSARANRGVAPMPVIDRMRAAATTVLPPAPDSGPLCGAPAEGIALIERWLYEPGTRLVDVADQLSLPIGAATRWLDFAQTARAAREAVAGR